MADASGVHGILFKTVHEVNGTPVVRDVHVPSSAIAADYKALATAFANEGIAFRAIYPKEQHGVRAFILAEFEAVKGEPVAKVVTHLGWQDDGSFATGGLLVTPTGVQSAVTAGSAKTGERRFKPAGTLQAQFDMLRTYSEHGSDAAKFVMACAVGSPAHGIEGRGAPLTVLTGETNLGKTAVCRAAMSIWCNPSETILTPNDTLAASHDRAGTLRNLPIVQDEVTYNDIQGLAAMVHALSSGGDRATMLQNQTLRPNAPRWATAAFWTSNTSIVAQLAGVSHANDAVANRVFELRLTEPTLNVPDMDTLAAVNTGYQKNCGHLGIELAKHYVSNRAMLAKRHEDFGAVVTKVVPGGLTGPLRYWAQLAQTFLSGAAILNELGYMMLDQATAMSILGRLMASAEDQSTSRRSSALGTIRDFLTAHAESTVQIVYKPGPVVQGMERAKDIYLPSGRGAVARIEMTSGAAYYDVLIAKSYLTEWLARRSGELNAMVSKAFSEGLMVSATDASGVADLYEGAVRVDRNNSGHAAGFVDVEVVRFRVPTSSTKATPVDVPDDETNVVAFPPLHGGV